MMESIGVIFLFGVLYLLAALPAALFLLAAGYLRRLWGFEALPPLFLSAIKILVFTPILLLHAHGGLFVPFSYVAFFSSMRFRHVTIAGLREDTTIELTLAAMAVLFALSILWERFKSRRERRREHDDTAERKQSDAQIVD